MLPTAIVHQILKNTLGLSEEQIRSHTDEAHKHEQSLEQFLVDQSIIPEQDLYTKASELLQVPFVNVKEKDIPKNILELVPAPFAETHHVIAFAKDNETLSIATTDPTDLQSIEFLKKKIGLPVKVHISTLSSIKLALRNYHSDLASEDVIKKLSNVSSFTQKGQLEKVAEEIPIVNILNTILEHAVYENASDIHIEPTEHELSVRYRVDGVLKRVMNLPKQTQNGILARIKILAHLKIDEHMTPQDGRFKIKVEDDTLSLRVSIVPVFAGEKIVMRLLHEGEKALSLDQLGFLPGPKALVEEAIKKPHGMLLVTGPTGSGKTTTLYSILGIVNTPKVNICTIEDPIEYHVSGINQSQINPRAGFTFASGLRAFLRQDPDIIMVGEIRDQETAEIAIHAAMTGHLVLSTLHTNDAATTIPRLVDMDVPPFLVAFTINSIVAQRLVRRLCDECKQSFTISKEAAKELSTLIHSETLLALYDKLNISRNSEENSLENMIFYKSTGCKRCHESGYKGRIGIYEVLTMDKEISDMINSRAGAKEILEYTTQKQGMVTMLHDGLIKAKQGITTIEEVLRVTRE